MKQKIVSSVTLFVSCGMFSHQCFGHVLSVPHTHMGLAMVALFAFVAMAVTVAAVFKKRRS